MNPKTTRKEPKWLQLGLMAGFAILVWLFSRFPGAVERFYSTGIYPGISLFLRILTRYFPFSVGDVLYVVIIIWLITRLVKVVILVAKGKFSKEWLLYAVYRTAHFVLSLYILFKLLWGLNYNRLGIEYQLGIARKTYTKEEVVSLTNQLINKVNDCRRQLPDTLLPAPPLDSLYREAYRAYQSVSYTYDFLNYRNLSVKSSLFSELGSYLGFSGYYNPFSGEAQLRTDIPRVLIPYIACHEMAHQLGYASESEANFVGYLAAAASENVYFRYSVYLDLFSYAQGEEISMFVQDTSFGVLDSVMKYNRDHLDTLVKKDRNSIMNFLMKKRLDSVIRYNREHLDTMVKKDRRAIREFFAKRRNRVSPAVSSLYDQYLKMNRQSQGIRSYDEVIGWLIAYQKKYGKL